MRDFSIKKCNPTHHFAPHLDYDADNKTFLVNGVIIPLNSIKWCCHTERKGTFYWDRIHSITFWYNDKEPGTPARLYHCFVDDIPYSADVIAFFKSLGLVVAEGRAEGKVQEEKYRKLRAEIFYEEHKEEIETAKKTREKEMEHRRKTRWPIVKWFLISFYSLFGVCVLAAALGII